MINFSLEKQLQIFTPNTNKALALALKSASPSELALLSKGKDLAAILDSFLQKSTQDTTQNATLLTLLKNNPTLKSLGDLNTTLKSLSSLLTQEKTALGIEKVVKNLLSDIQNIDPKELKNKILHSGVFLESNLANAKSQTQLKEIFSNDLKALLLKTQDELANTNTPKSQEILKQVEKLLLQIDYYQLNSHLSNASSFYLPYNWDDLSDANMQIKKAKESLFVCDIELTLKEYGELRLRLGLFEKKELSVHIKAESKVLKSLIQEHLSELKQALLAVGITPKEIRFLDEVKEKHNYEQNTDEVAMGFEVKV